MKTKRGKVPSLIAGSNGKPSVVIVKKQRKCVRCDEKIPKGSQCFEIPKVGGGFSNKKPYCNTCFENVLEQTDIDLTALRKCLDELKSGSIALEV